MTLPRDASDAAAAPTTATDLSATARMPLPGDARPAPDPPAATPWTPRSASPPPDWRPERTREGRGPSLLFGLILLAVGLWFFADQTLGLDLPTLRWSQLWPVILIIIGAWVLFGARRRAD